MICISRIILTFVFLGVLIGPCAAQRDSLVFALLEPRDETPVQYEKIEWGLRLPAQINNAISNWITNQERGTNLKPSINPFDPDDIEVQAEIFKNGIGTAAGEGLVEIIDGFFYLGYSRNTTDSDRNLWDWTEKSSEFDFRVRYSALTSGEYNIKYTVNTKLFGVLESALSDFSVVQGDQSKGFVSISKNKHYFVTPDQQVFIPIGKNIWEGAFDCYCNIPDQIMEPGQTSANSVCDKCFDTGEDDICCGLNTENRLSRYKIWKKGKTVREMCLPLVSYIKLHQVLEQYARSGANTVRFPVIQSSFDFEFEKINNYYDRQYQAWEFDQLVEHCSELDLRIQLNMGLQTIYQNHPYGNVNWDWFDTNVCDEPGKSQAWCYRNDLKLENPIDFFASADARNYYKKKLRYFIARWGYSKDIILIELLSEMNGVGSGTVYEHSAEGCTYWNNPKHIPLRYDIDMAYRRTLSSWNLEMASYIKNTLEHKRHMLSVDYTGRAPMGIYTDSPDNPCGSEYLDMSWNSPDLDVICWNNYGAGATRFRGFAVDEYGVKGGQPGLQCDENNEPTVGFQATTKPVLYGENGFGDHIMSCDHTGFIKELVALPFTGHANSGMSWDEVMDTTHWLWMGSISRFLDSEVYPFVDLGKEDWMPTYANSESGGTSKVETVFLKNRKRGNKKLVGVLMNRSWNWYTASEGGTCDKLPDESVIPVFMNPFTDASPGEEPIRISSMETMRKYTIEYFDPISGEVLGTATDTSLNGRIILKNYPTLTAERPLVYFKVARSKVLENETVFTGRAR